MATNVWLGRAPAVAQVDTWTLTGAWVVGNSATCTIGDISVSHTIGGDTTDFLTEFAAVLNASAAPEFAEITFARTSATTMTLTANTAGVPFTATKAKSGDGDISIATTTANSGPADASVASNWSAGRVPDADAVVFEDNDQDCLYGLDLSDNLLTSATIKQSYTGRIGLPRTHAGDTDEESYPEYRRQYLKIKSPVLSIGEGDGDGSGRLKVEMTSGTTTYIQVHNSGMRAEADVPAVLIKGEASASLSVSRGDVGVAYFTGEVIALEGPGCCLLRVGHAGDVDGDATVVCGSGTMLSTVIQSGGKLQLASGTLTLTQHAGTLTLLGSEAHGTITAHGKVIDRGSGNMTELQCAGEYDHSQALDTRTITHLFLHRGAKYRDPHGLVTATNGIACRQCTINDLDTFEVAPDKAWTAGNIVEPA